MRILKYLMFLLLIFVIGAAIYVAVQPNEFKFERSAIIEAPVEVVYNKVNNLEAWPEFSPWLEKERDAKVTFHDISSGKNAAYNWDGDEIGKGRMKTIETDPFETIEQQIVFEEPYKSEANITWTFQSVDDGTKVTWAMDGKQDFMTKLNTTINGSIEDNTAPDFERGLFKLDSISEAEIKKYSVKVNGITQYSGGYYLYTTYSTKISEMEGSMQEGLKKLKDYAQANAVSVAGSQFNIYHNWDMENNAVMYSACLPTTSKIISNEADILTGQIEPFMALKTTLNGKYDYLEEAWSKATNYIINDPTLEQVEDGPQLEIYVKGPEDSPNPAKWTTEIYISTKQL